MAFLWMIIFVFQSAVESQKICTDIIRFSDLLSWNYVTGTEFLTFPNTTLLACAKQCKLRNRCTSFNFDVISGVCVLNEGSRTNTSLSFTTSVDNVYSDVDGWQDALAGACASHTCPENTHCRVDETGLYGCVVESCIDPPAVAYAEIQSSSRFIQVGARVPYKCPIPFSPSGETICLPNNTWAGEFKCLRIRSCSDVKACNNSYGDGEYWIYLKQGTYSLLKVYCHNMENNPKAYLTLNGNTYSHWLNRSLAEKCEDLKLLKYCGKTVFGKIKIFPWRLRFKIYDYTFATTDCLFSPLGWAGGCSLCSDSPVHGSFRIDTSGTGVKVAEGVSWISNTGQLDATWNRTGDGRVITGACRSECGYCKPAGVNVTDTYFNFDRDPTYNPDLSQATFPQCSVPNP